MGRGPRRRDPAQRRRRLRPGRCSSPAARRARSWSRRSSTRPRRRRCATRPGAAASRARTSRSSTCGSPTRAPVSPWARTTCSSIRRTGGQTWESWFDRSDNPRFLNLHAIRPAGGSLYIAGEAGLLLRYDGAKQRFAVVPVPYKGSFFGVADAQGRVVAFGLRGKRLGERRWPRVVEGRFGPRGGRRVGHPPARRTPCARRRGRPSRRERRRGPRLRSHRGTSLGARSGHRVRERI